MSGLWMAASSIVFRQPYLHPCYLAFRLTRSSKNHYVLRQCVSPCLVMTNIHPSYSNKYLNITICNESSLTNLYSSLIIFYNCVLLSLLDGLLFFFCFLVTHIHRIERLLFLNNIFCRLIVWLLIFLFALPKLPSGHLLRKLLLFGNNWQWLVYLLFDEILFPLLSPHNNILQLVFFKQVHDVVDSQLLLAALRQLTVLFRDLLFVKCTLITAYHPLNQRNLSLKVSDCSRFHSKS